MRKSFFILCFVNIFQFINSKSDLVDQFSHQKKSKEENFVVVSSNKNDIKNFYKGVTFKTPNGLIVTYFGSRYSVHYLKEFLSSCIGPEEEFVKLSNLGFNEMFFSSENHLEIKDALKIEAVDFCVTYEDDNQVKAKKYSKSSSPLSYYDSYLQISGVKLKNQSLNPINLRDIKISIDKLKIHFIRLGYNYVDVGYQLVQNKKTKHLKVVYHIDLGALQANTIQFVGGNSALNNILKSKCPRYIPAIFEVTSNYLFISDFIEVIKKQYFDLGYFKVKIDSYFDQYEKKLVYLINSDDRFSIENWQIDSSVCDFTISDKQKEQIEKIIAKDSRLYNINKKKSIERIISTFYDKDEYSLKFLLDKNYSKKTVSMLFTFDRKKMSPNKILTSIKCVGNSKISSNRIKEFLGKKIGDMISNDDVFSLKLSLLRTRCFKSVDIKLNDVGDHYELIIDVKEDRLFDIKNLGLSFDPNISVNLAFNKKNIVDSGKNLDFTLYCQKTEVGSQALVLDVGFEGFLPNGNSYNFGARLQYNGDILKAKSKGLNLFDQDGGGYASIYLSTEFFGFDHQIDLGYRYFISLEKGVGFVTVKTDIINKYFSTYNSATRFCLNNEITFHMKKNIWPQDRLTAFFDHIYVLSENFKFYCKLQAGCLISDLPEKNKNEFSKYYKFQGFYFFDIGQWGPKEDGYVVGGNSKIGGQLKLTYELNYSFMPDFFIGTLLFGQFEIGSIFNSKIGDVKEHCVSGLASGLELPIMNGQINVRLFYFYPLHNNSCGSLTKAGWQLGLNLAFQPFD